MRINRIEKMPDNEESKPSLANEHIQASQLRQQKHQDRLSASQQAEGAAAVAMQYLGNHLRQGGDKLGTAGEKVGGAVGSIPGTVSGPSGIAEGSRAGAQLGSLAGRGVSQAGSELEQIGKLAREGDARLTIAQRLRQQVAQKRLVAFREAAGSGKGEMAATGVKMVSAKLLQSCWLGMCSFFPITLILGTLYIDLHLFVYIVSKGIFKKPIIAALGEEWLPPGLPPGSAGPASLGFKLMDIFNLLLINIASALIVMAIYSIVVVFGRWLSMSKLEQFIWALDNWRVIWDYRSVL